ncbi:MAG: tail fiber domain-containing protein [Thermodesulfobacteriota bacterium]
MTINSNSSDDTFLLLDGSSKNAAQMRIINSGNSWIVRAHGSATKFRIDEVNTTGVSMDVTAAGQMTLGSGITANGNSTINGNLTVTGLFNGSSRTLKTDIVPVDSREILKKVAQLPIYSWRYTADETKTTQFGPMAEDFQQTFGVGDGYYLAGNTTAGASLAAIRGLNEIVQEEEKEIERLRASNEELAQRLTALEKQLERMR